MKSMTFMIMTESSAPVSHSSLIDREGMAAHMDKKIMAIATVVALIAIIGGIAYAMHKEDSRCDYSLLDSTDNIKEGFTVTYEGVDEDGTVHSKKVVDSVENGKVNYTLYIDIQDQSSFYELDHFLPGYPIDYTSDIPAGIKVVKDGDRYTITGTMENHGFDTTLTMAIVYDGEHVQFVEGTMTTIYQDDRTDDLAISVFSTEDGKVRENYSLVGCESASMSVQRFWEQIGYLPPSVLEESTVEDGRYGGVDVKIYTFNGKIGSRTYTDYKFYVYDGHALKEEGDVESHGFTHHDIHIVKVYQA